MNFAGRVAVVTGGAGGIGRAIALRLAREGAQVVVADRDLAAAEDTAARAGGVAFRTDVSRPADLVALVAHVEQRVGPIDLFCSNAGTAAAGGAELPDEEWQRVLEVNLMAHVRAARVVVPDMLRRGQGHWVVVASAAGLLTQVGSAPYAVSKAGAVAFAEWLAITYGGRGLKVTCVCPQGVRTPMLAADPRIAALLEPAAIEPEAVADAVIAGLRSGEFLVLPHPEVAEFVRRKADDRDRWIRGVQRIQQHYESLE
ncbi:MAG: SDR family oxidoreductase [Gemmatimonadales bacterium]